MSKDLHPYSQTKQTHQTNVDNATIFSDAKSPKERLCPASQVVFWLIDSYFEETPYSSNIPKGIFQYWAKAVHLKMYDSCVYNYIRFVGECEHLR